MSSFFSLAQRRKNKAAPSSNSSSCSVSTASIEDGRIDTISSGVVCSTTTGSGSGSGNYSSKMKDIESGNSVNGKLMEDEREKLIPPSPSSGTRAPLPPVEPPANAVAAANTPANADAGGITSMGMKVLILLAVQNASKNLLMGFVMKDKPLFLKSAAVIAVEMIKVALSCAYIIFAEGGSVGSILYFLKDDYYNGLLLIVPAAVYNLQKYLEFVALANIDPAVFSVLVQTKMLAAASFAVLILRKQIKKVQVISLTLLTAGVMLCNMKDFMKAKDMGGGEGDDKLTQIMTGIAATLGISFSSGFASVYTEKVIKAQRNTTGKAAKKNYSLAYTQVQLAGVSVLVIGIWAVVADFNEITQHGLWYKFDGYAFVTCFNNAIGGLIVAAVLKFADSVLKGYATACSVVLTGVGSMILFGTDLSVLYGIGIINVICAVLLYNAKDLDRYVC